MVKVIVITGSTRGIGRGLAEGFLARDCAVLINGRNAEGVAQACAELRARFPEQGVIGFAGDVRDPVAHQGMWQRAQEVTGRVDIWINNAGLAPPVQPIIDLSPDQAAQVVDVNLLGVIYGTQVAVRGMLAQGQGSLYNMEGAGSDGRTHDGMILYGTTKYAVHYFTQGIIQETADSPVLVGSLQPGMVITDLLLDEYKDRPEDWERDKRIFNIIGDRVETVAPWLVEQILANQQHGAHISWSSRWKIMARFLTAPLSKRDLFADEETA